jgi:hypothetical protein
LRGEPIGLPGKVEPGNGHAIAIGRPVFGEGGFQREPDSRKKQRSGLCLQSKSSSPTGSSFLLSDHYSGDDSSCHFQLAAFPPVAIQEKAIKVCDGQY